MDISRIVFEHADSQQWVRCYKFTSTHTEQHSQVTLYTDTGTMQINGATARQFYRKLFIALQQGKRILRLQPIPTDICSEATTEATE